MRSVGSNIPLSSPDLELSFPSVPEVSSTPTSEKELPLVYPAPIDEVERTPRPTEPTPTAMIPEQRSESLTVHPNTTESVPTAVPLRRSTKIRKAPDRLML
ncbi:hypothetical protein AVEN_169361-1 [Araneus ventricosus]|uniref:Uncharacterized protein n=1 Tax=Araneus ventricosus TaxID=182803 RepID=A0A4Y2LFE6_ARAVE|nr:hypothetical protein AVEN_4879-1 [Araneus ventricosus]GBN95723.1 hypothetical protein AVEN_169361-1 [Araneus ventricosus]